MLVFVVVLLAFLAKIEANASVNLTVPLPSSLTGKHAFPAGFQFGVSTSRYAAQ